MRLKGYDYSKAGAFFITICCANRERRFGKIESGEMILNPFGLIAFNEWIKLPQRFVNCDLDVFQIMPNHMHGILVLKNPEGAGLTPATNEYDDGDLQNKTDHFLDNFENGHHLPNAKMNFIKSNINNGVNDPNTTKTTARVAPASLGGIVGAYKSLVTNECLKICKSKNETMGKIWQRNYYERIIRNEISYQNISAYIINNPKKWAQDKFYG